MTHLNIQATDWYSTGLRPFIPLIPNNAATIVVATTVRGRVRIGTWRRPIDASDYVKVTWSTDVSFPPSMVWKDQSEYQPDHFDRLTLDGRICLIILSEFVESSGIRELQTYWRRLASGDTMIVASNNRIPLVNIRVGGLTEKSVVSPRYFFLSVRVLRCLRSFDKTVRIYMCFGRRPNNTLRLISTRFFLQRRFILAAKGGRSLPNLMYRFASNVGIYPWLAREHIFVVKK